jgi:Pilus assembly protein, PilP
MRKLTLFPRAATLSAAMFVLCAAPLAAQTLAPVKISVRDAAVSEILFELARLEQIPLVLGNGAFDARITLDQTFRSSQAAIDAITQQKSLRVVRRGVVQIVTDQCTAIPPPKPLNPFSDNRLSLNFFKLDMPTALSLLQYVSSREIDEDAFKGGNGRRVGMTLQSQPARMIFESLAVATGTSLLAATNRSYIISELADAKKNCPSSGGATSDMPSRDRAMCPRMTVYPATAEIPCQSLEFYKFDEITLRGYIQRGERMLAIADTRDGLSWSIATGQYIGEHHAKVEAMDEKGLTFKELFINRYGYPFDRKFILGYDGTRTGVPEL